MIFSGTWSASQLCLLSQRFRLVHSVLLQSFVGDWAQNTNCLVRAARPIAKLCDRPMLIWCINLLPHARVLVLLYFLRLWFAATGTNVASQRGRRRNDVRFCCCCFNAAAHFWKCIYLFICLFWSFVQTINNRESTRTEKNECASFLGILNKITRFVLAAVDWIS